MVLNPITVSFLTGGRQREIKCRDTGRNLVTIKAETGPMFPKPEMHAAIQS
jgi:hypothetical protein